MTGEYDMVALLIWFFAFLGGLYALVALFGRNDWPAPVFAILMFLLWIPMMGVMMAAFDRVGDRRARRMGQ